MKYIDPLGLARVCRRALAGTSGMINGGDLDTLNLEVSHQHIFYDDHIAYSASNAGYHGEDEGGGSGVFWERANDGGRMTLDYIGDGYDCETRYYDDGIMSQAVENLRYAENWRADRYGFILHNCQDFVSAVLQEYYRLGGALASRTSSSRIRY